MLFSWGVDIIIRGEGEKCNGEEEANTCLKYREMSGYKGWMGEKGVGEAG